MLPRVTDQTSSAIDFNCPYASAHHLRRVVTSGGLASGYQIRACAGDVQFALAVVVRLEVISHEPRLAGMCFKHNAIDRLAI